LEVLKLADWEVLLLKLGLHVLLELVSRACFVLVGLELVILIVRETVGSSLVTQTEPCHSVGSIVRLWQDVPGSVRHEFVAGLDYSVVMAGVALLCLMISQNLDEFLLLQLVLID